MPIKDRAIAEPAMQRKVPLPAAYMRGGLCSECLLEPLLCGEGDLKVCPRCYTLLWHKDFAAQLRRELVQKVAQEKARALQLRKAKEGKLREQAYTVLLQLKRKRLIALIWARAQRLWQESLSKESRNAK